MNVAVWLVGLWLVFALIAVLALAIGVGLGRRGSWERAWKQGYIAGVRDADESPNPTVEHDEPEDLSTRTGKRADEQVFDLSDPAG